MLCFPPSFWCSKILGEMAFDLSITPCHQERGIWNTLLLQFNAGQYEVKQVSRVENQIIVKSIFIWFTPP